MKTSKNNVVGPKRREPRPQPVDYFETKDFKEYQRRVVSAVKAAERVGGAATFRYLLGVVGRPEWLHEAARLLVAEGRLFVSGPEGLSYFHTTPPARSKDLSGGRVPQKTKRTLLYSN